MLLPASVQPTTVNTSHMGDSARPRNPSTRNAFPANTGQRTREAKRIKNRAAQCCGPLPYSLFEHSLTKCVACDGVQWLPSHLRASQPRKRRASAQQSPPRSKFPRWSCWLDWWVPRCRPAPLPSRWPLLQLPWRVVTCWSARLTTAIIKLSFHF
jgi:hypothetical protein